MLDELGIIDFKTHKNTTLKFSSGINVITGDSGQGKTNILLALNWVKDNRPLGSSCIRRGQNSSTVVAKVIDDEDTCSLIRKRSKSENIYDIEKDGVRMDPPFSSFGNAPPEQVSDILNLTDINVQKQRDQHFLVYSSPGQVATYIRSITKLDEIDRVTKKLSSKIHTERGEISRREAELKSTNEKLAILNKIDLESLECKITEAKDRILKANQIREKIERIQFIIKAIKTLEECWIHLPDNIDKIFEDTDFVQESIVKISTRLSKLMALINKIKKIEACKITLPEDLTILSTGEQVLEKYNDICKRIEILQGLIEKIHNVKSKIGTVDKQLNQLEIEEQELMKELSACPSCGTELTSESKRILLCE